MAIAYEDKKDVLVIKVSGKSLSGGESAEIAKKVSENEKPLVVLDLTGLNDLSVSALDNLAKGFEQKGGGRAAVFGSFDLVRLIKQRGLSKHFAYIEETDKGLGAQEASPEKVAFEASFQNFIDVISQTVIKVFKDGMAVDVKIASTRVDLPAPPFETELGAVMDLVSVPFSGSVLLSFRRKTFDVFIAKLFGDLFDPTLGEEVISAGAAEILNMVNGAAKGELNLKGFGIAGQPPPETVHEENLFLRQVGHKTVTVVFDCDHGDFFLELIATPTKES